MGTIIKSISFQNFYNYYGNLEQNKYVFKEGLNIISADNNMGKSKFYNGILWILQDKVYDSDLKKLDFVTNSFIKIASGKSKTEEKEFETAVQINFSSEENEYIVKKSFKLIKNNNEWNIQGNGVRTDVTETINGKTTPIYENGEQVVIINKIIPLEMLNYALLQGESMESLVDLSSQNGLSNTIEILAGIADLSNICLSTKEYTKLANKLLTDKEGESTTNKTQFEKIYKEKELLERNKEQAEEKILEYKKELSYAKSEKERLEALIVKAKEREQYRGESFQKEKRINELKASKIQKEKEITSKLFRADTPWLLIGLEKEIDIFSNLREDFIKEKAQAELIKNPNIFLLPEGSPDIPSLRRMLETEMCEVCGRIAEKNSDSWIHIKRILERPKTEIDNSRNDFSNFYGEIQKNIGSQYSLIPLIQEKVEEYRNEVEDIKNSITEAEEEFQSLKLKYFNAGGEKNSDHDVLNLHSLQSNNIQKNEKLIKDTENNINIWKRKISDIDIELEELSSEDTTSEYRKFKLLMSDIDVIFNDTKNRIYDEIIALLEKNANIKYSELTRGNQVSGGTLCFSKQEDETVHVSIKDIKNGEITGLGTGFQRMKQLSIVMAIISSKIGNKQFQYPFISDAPFSEFGTNFINNFFHVAPNVFSQSIILIKELYDPNNTQFLNSLGEKILEEMKDGRIKGTFYINVIEEKVDTTELVTKNRCYKY